MKTLHAPAVAVAAFAAAVACATGPAPRELVDARAAYARAASSDAAELSPAALRDAKKALAVAEHAYRDRDDALVTRDRAYVAIRKAELAEVLASTERARQNQSRANIQSNTERNRAADESNGMGDAERRLSDAERRVNRSDSNPANDRAAQANAEANAREALERLSASNVVLAVKDEPRGTVITVPAQTLFAAGKADLLPGAEARLQPVAQVLKQEKDHKILVVGHTDSLGPDGTNRDLSQKRADAVRDFLVAHEVPSDQVTATGMGESKPIGDNSTPEGRATNRRVEIVVEPVDR